MAKTLSTRVDKLEKKTDTLLESIKETDRILRNLGKETDRRFRESDAKTDKRIADLVSAIGNLISKIPPSALTPKNEDDHA